MAPCLEKPIPQSSRKRLTDKLWSLAGASKKRKAEAQEMVDQLTADLVEPQDEP